MLMSYALESAGLTFEDVELNVLQDANAQVQAFAAGQIDAMVTFPPNINRMIAQRPGTSVIREYTDIVFPGTQIITNTAWVSSNRGDAMAAMRAMNRALEMWSEKPDEAKAVIAKSLNLPTGDPLIDELYEFTLDEFSENVAAVDADMEKKLFALFRANGFPEAVEGVAELVIDPTLIEEALR